MERSCGIAHRRSRGRVEGRRAAVGRPTGAAREGRCEWGRGRGRGGAGPAFSPALFLLGGGGVGAAKGLLSCFLVPKGEPAHGLHPRFVVAEIWADRGRSKRGGGG